MVSVKPLRLRARVLMWPTLMRYSQSSWMRSSETCSAYRCNTRGKVKQAVSDVEGRGGQEERYREVSAERLAQMNGCSRSCVCASQSARAIMWFSWLMSYWFWKVM